MTKEALKLALEALEGIQRFGLDTLSGRVDGPDDREWQRAGVNEMTKRARLGITALEALAQPEQRSSEHLEPVAVVKENPFCPEGHSDELTVYLPVGTKLYTTPPQRKPLTDEQIMEMVFAECDNMRWPSTALYIARAIEAAHNIKE